MIRVKIHVSNNSLLSICLLIMLDTLLLVPSLHCNTLLHLTTLHQTTLHYTYRHFTSSYLHFTTLPWKFHNENYKIISKIQSTTTQFMILLQCILTLFLSKTCFGSSCEPSSGWLFFLSKVKLAMLLLLLPTRSLITCIKIDVKLIPLYNSIKK